jgi:hypothetical protein
VEDDGRDDEDDEGDGRDDAEDEAEDATAEDELILSVMFGGMLSSKVNGNCASMELTEEEMAGSFQYGVIEQAALEFVVELVVVVVLFGMRSSIVNGNPASREVMDDLIP